MGHWVIGHWVNSYYLTSRWVNKVVMKKTVFGLAILISCTSQYTNLSKQASAEIINADKAMSNMAVREGFFKTLLLYADDGVVKPQEGMYPVI